MNEAWPELKLVDVAKLGQEEMARARADILRNIGTLKPS